MKGVITKGIGGFYYIQTDKGIIESRARGVFREDKKKPLVGDFVKIKINEDDNTGYILDILERKTILTRPPVANVTKAIIVMSIVQPQINLWLLDKFLLMADYQNLDILICINKSELNLNEAKRVKQIYRDAGYDVILTSAKDNIGISDLEQRLENNISVFAGPSGAGKSSLLNKINEDLGLEVGGISKKTERGKHTTRHVELIKLFEDSYVLDTPGFSSLNLNFIEDERTVKDNFKEIKKYASKCKFNSCLHDKEPNCNVKKQVEQNNISKSRYDNYLSLYNEVKKIRRY